MTIRLICCLHSQNTQLSQSFRDACSLLTSENVSRSCAWLLCFFFTSAFRSNFLKIACKSWKPVSIAEQAAGSLELFMKFLSQQHGIFVCFPTYLKTELQFSSISKLQRKFQWLCLFAKFEILDDCDNYLIHYVVG